MTDNKKMMLKKLSGDCIKRINEKKIALMQADTNRGNVSNDEAVERLIMGDEFYESNKKHLK